MNVLDVLETRNVEPDALVLDSGNSVLKVWVGNSDNETLYQDTIRSVYKEGSAVRQTDKLTEQNLLSYPSYTYKNVQYFFGKRSLELSAESISIVLDDDPLKAKREFFVQKVISSLHTYFKSRDYMSLHIRTLDPNPSSCSSMKELEGTTICFTIDGVSKSLHVKSLIVFNEGLCAFHYLQEEGKLELSDETGQLAFLIDIGYGSCNLRLVNRSGFIAARLETPIYSSSRYLMNFVNSKELIEEARGYPVQLDLILDSILSNKDYYPGSHISLSSISSSFKKIWVDNSWKAIKKSFPDMYHLVSQVIFVGGGSQLFKSKLEGIPGVSFETDVLLNLRGAVINYKRKEKS